MTAPWNAYQWVNCNGSVMMQTLYPGPTETDAQREADAVKEIIKDILSAWQSIDHPLPTMSTLVGHSCTNGVILDDDMAQAAIDFVTSVMTYINATGTLALMDLDTVLDLSGISPDMTNDRPDVFICNPERHEIFIASFEYGHRLVEVYENHKLSIYAQGVIDHYGINGLADQVYNVIARIHQPRASHQDGPVRDWEFKAVDLRGHINVITHAVEMSYSGDGKCRSGDWCSTCTGRHACETFTRDVYAAMDYAGGATPHVLDERGLVAEYLLLQRAKKLIESRFSAINSQCVGAIKNGQRLPGLTTQQGYGHEKWQNNVNLDEVIMMADLMGVDINKPREIDTPAQVRKKGIDPEVVKQYTYKPKTSLKIVKDDGAKARQVFRK